MFNKQFSFGRQLNETMAFANIQKNGDFVQREQLDVLKMLDTGNLSSRSFAKDFANKVNDKLFETTSKMTKTMGNVLTEFLEISLEPIHNQINENQHFNYKRKKKGKSQVQGISR